MVEVLLHAPPTLTPAEKLLLTVIAESCHPKTRMTWYRTGWDATEVARRAQLTTGSLGKTFWSLAQKGCEVRVAHGTDKKGRPVFAYKGRQTTFRMPNFAPQRSDEGRTIVTGDAPNGPTYVAVRSDEDPTFEAQRSDEGRTLLLKELPSKNTSPPPTPSTALTLADVVDAEIVEEEADSTSSLEPQIQKLIDEAVTAKPNWRRKRNEIRGQIDALLLTFGEKFDLVAQVVRETALAADTGHPARITVAQNPAMVKANAQLLFANVDACGPGAPFNQHPAAHPFEPMDDGSPSCARRPLPMQNGRHRVGNQGGGYVAQRRNLNAEHNGAWIGPTGYHHLTDSRAPGRDYSEPL